MKLHVTRASVCAGDDADAPHHERLDFPDVDGIVDAVARVVASGYLASISTGEATWSAWSGGPIAVVAQQWPAIRVLPAALYGAVPVIEADGVKLHFSYHAQRDPQIVYDVLAELRLDA